MTRVLVVHHDIDYADLEMESLRRAGYRVTECTGPLGAARPCPVLRGHPCPLAEAADVLVYDVWASDAAETRRLVESLHAQHPEKPIILTSPGLAPEWTEEEHGMPVVTVLGIPSKRRLGEAIEAALGRAPVLV